MLPDYGRVVSNFIVQVMRVEPLTLSLYGSQTRSFCCVSDLMKGLILLMNGDHPRQLLLGNLNEFTIRKLAEIVRIWISLELQLVERPLLEDDPQQRQPKVDLARQQLDWQPTVSLEQDLALTIDSFRNLLGLAKGRGT